MFICVWSVGVWEEGKEGACVRINDGYLEQKKQKDKQTNNTQYTIILHIYLPFNLHDLKTGKYTSLNSCNKIQVLRIARLSREVKTTWIS